MAVAEIHGLVVTSDRALPGEPTTASSTIVIKSDPTLALEPEWIGETEWPSIAVASDRVAFRFDGDLDLIWQHDDGRLTYVEHRPLDIETFTHELVDHVLPRIAAAIGNHVLHGAAVADERGALVLVGPSGAGKSTTAAALARAGYALLGDDVAVLRASLDGWAIRGSAPRLRLHADSAAAVLGDPEPGPPMAEWSAKRVVTDLPPAPADEHRVVAIVELAEPSDDLRLEPVGAAEAFTVVARHSFDLPDPSPAAGIRALDKWAPVVDTIPVWRLHRPFDFARLPEVVDVLSGLLRDGA